MLDIKTIIILILIVNFINAFTMTFLWLQYRKRFSGLSHWLTQMTFQALGVVFILVRAVVPGLFPILLGNFFLVSGPLALQIGLERFIGLRSRQTFNFALQGVFLAGIAYFYSAQPDLAMREILFSAMVVVVNAQSCVLLFRKSPAEYRKSIRPIGIMLAGHVLSSFLRLVLLIAFPHHSSDLFRTGFVDAVAFTLYFAFNIGLMITLELAVNGRLLNEVRVQEEKFSKAFKSSPYAIILTRVPDGTILEVNDAFVEMTGYGYGEAIGKTSRDLDLWVDDAERSAMLKKAAEDGKIHGVELQFRRKSGDLLIGLFSTELLVISGERCILSSINDVTEQTLLKRKLEELATQDPLTGLPNRRLLEDRFSLLAAAARRSKKSAAVLSLDLDKFKDINDAYGHAAGDAVLVEAAVRLRASLRKADTVARVGGDEFVVLLGDVDTDDAALEVANKILQSFRRPLVLSGNAIAFSASIGVALFPSDGGVLEDLLRKSDKALYDVKARGRDGCGLA